MPNAPWTNGAAERMVRTVKSGLTTFDKRCASTMELQRLLTGVVEYIVNRRPILFKDGRMISAFEIATGRQPVIAIESIAKYV